jgi:hypothetical protein
MASSLHEEVIPFVPAFMAYEKGLVEWFGKIPLPRDESHNLEFKVEYAGGERAIRAIKALKGDDNRNDKARTPLITIRLTGVEYNQQRYHPPESYWAKAYVDGPPSKARRAARISKPAPYKISYECQIYPNFEIDLRFAMGAILNSFHRYGGLSYLRVNNAFVDGVAADSQIFPMFLKSYSHGVDSNTGEGERIVKGTIAVEIEAYLALPYRFVPTFRKLHQSLLIQGEPGVVIPIP